MSHDFLSTFPLKTAEYLVGISYLISFVFFWRFVNGGKAATQPVMAKQPHRAESTFDFLVPEGVFFHPGHAWAKLAEPKLAMVGMDDFAQKLVGGIGAVKLPQVGARLAQGDRAITIHANGKSVDMLSPIDGKVVAVNDAIANDPAALKRDPYGAGWLFKVEPERPEANLRQLFSGASAKRWVAQAWEDLRANVSPELGLVAQDGGAPVDGIAPNLDPENWDRIARNHFLT